MQIFSLQKTEKTLKYSTQSSFISRYLNLQGPELCYYSFFLRFWFRKQLQFIISEFQIKKQILISDLTITNISATVMEVTHTGIKTKFDLWAARDQFAFEN